MANESYGGDPEKKKKQGGLLSGIADYTKNLLRDEGRSALVAGGFAAMDPNNQYDAQGFHSPWSGINAGIKAAQLGAKGVAERQKLRDTKSGSPLTESAYLTAYSQMYRKFMGDDITPGLSVQGVPFSELPRDQQTALVHETLQGGLGQSTASEFYRKKTPLAGARPNAAPAPTPEDEGFNLMEELERLSGKAKSIVPPEVRTQFRNDVGAGLDTAGQRLKNFYTPDPEFFKSIPGKLKNYYNKP